MFVLIEDDLDAGPQPSKRLRLSVSIERGMQAA